MSKTDAPHLVTAQRLRKVRDFYGLNQKEFARNAGLGITQYANMETGLRRPSVKAAVKLMEAYDLSLDFIFLGKLSALPENMRNALLSKPTERK